MRKLSPDRDVPVAGTVRIVLAPAGMQEAGRRPGRQDVNPVPQIRAELVRYFAWGYLSRRELNARLRSKKRLPRALRSAA